jgi:Protein of unknown function (DUF3285)
MLESSESQRDRPTTHQPMTQSSTPPESPLSDTEQPASEQLSPEQPVLDSKPQPSYVKLAMRNMVKKRGTSLFHFGLTAIVLLSILVGLAYLTR